MLKLVNLDSVRAPMLEEFERDVTEGTMYRSERLTDYGWSQYANLMREAIWSHDDEWLAREINRRDLLETHEQKRKPKGGFTMAKVPVTAAHTLAEGEFNRFYIRAVCRSAIESNMPDVMVYRAKAVAQPRHESQLLIGRRLPAAAILDDLRDNSSVDAALGVPAGPNSGLSVHL